MDTIETAARTDEAAETPLEPDAVMVKSAYLTSLENTRREYQVTVNTLAIVVEKLLEATGGGDTLYVEPETRNDAPDLRAGVNEQGQIWMRVSR